MELPRNFDLLMFGTDDYLSFQDLVSLSCCLSAHRVGQSPPRGPSGTRTCKVEDHCEDTCSRVRVDGKAAAS